MDLKTATVDLLRQHDIAEQIEVCDAMIRAYNKVPDRFVLPRQFAPLYPIISQFAGDPNGWANYIKILRDAVEGSAYDKLHEVYRTISTRALQNERRTRLRKALALLTKMLDAAGAQGPYRSYSEQLILGRKIELMWKDRRTAALADARAEYRAGRQPMEDKQALLAQFWQTIDTEIENSTLTLSDEFKRDVGL
jgi:hypothetical protein